MTLSSSEVLGINGKVANMFCNVPAQRSVRHLAGKKVKNTFSKVLYLVIEPFIGTIIVPR